MTLHEELLEIICCPECRGKLELTDNFLSCGECSQSYPIKDGVFRFVENEKYVGNFGFQWNKHKRTQFDTLDYAPSEAFMRKMGLSEEKMRGKLVLDAGCGSGRYSDVVIRWGGRVIGLDMSLAVDAYNENLKERGAIAVQADLMKAPFKDQVFDVIFSIGVLHHTPDTKKAFQSLVRYLKPGGLIVIWVYSAYLDDTFKMKLSNFYRKFTYRLPEGLLYSICYLAVPYYFLTRIPIVRSLAGRLWYISEHENWRWRVLDTFDWYSPRYQWHHTYPEVFNWFEESGLVDIYISEPAVTVGGYKPF